MKLLEEDLRERRFAKIEHLIRPAAPRTKGALVEAKAAALSATGARDSRGFFEHAGTRPSGQLLRNLLNIGGKRG